MDTVEEKVSFKHMQTSAQRRKELDHVGDLHKN